MKIDPKFMEQAKEMAPAMIRKESNNNPNAVSEAGAKGSMQLMEGAVKDVAAHLKVDPKTFDYFDEDMNIKWGTIYAAMKLQEFGGDKKKALAAYNMGAGRLKEKLKQYGVDSWDALAKKMKGKEFAETIDYVEKLA